MAIVTLTTDFGTADGYVGAMKGVILEIAPGTTIVDITHDVPAQDVAAAAFALAQAAPRFPPGTIHLAVIDPGVGGRRREVVLDDGRHLWVGPDNGVFSLAAPNVRSGFQISAPGFRCDPIAPTFHGRDIFAPAAARLAAGAAAADAGPPVQLEGTLGARPLLMSHGGRQVTGHVVHVDRFGNLVTDIPADAMPEHPVVRIGTVEIRTVRLTYTDVGKGEVLAYIGSGGTLEVGVRDGSARDALTVGRGAAVLVLGDAT
jgi:S-adenosyl-L-methionine hydrolase (adenosine-forming)